MSRENKYEHFIDETRKQIQEYINLKVELIKIDLQATAARVSAELFGSLLVIFIVIMVLLFASITAGFYLSHLFNDYVKGFGIIAAAYFVVLLLVLSVRKKFIQRKVADSIIALIHREND